MTTTTTKTRRGGDFSRARAKTRARRCDLSGGDTDENTNARVLFA